jgi:hypothetical protein
MMGEGWEWIHLASVGVVFIGYLFWIVREERHDV